MNAGKHPKVSEGGPQSARYGKWALWLIMITFVIPFAILPILETFNVGSPNLIFSVLFFTILVGLPCCLVSLVLGVIAIARNERPIKPAVLSVAIGIWPAPFGCWILLNFITMGKPW